jgi:hypothetical protein
MAYIGYFDEILLTAQPQVEAVVAASESLAASQPFRKVLEIILAFGNYMNSAKRGAAYVFNPFSTASLVVLVYGCVWEVASKEIRTLWSRMISDLYICSKRSASAHDVTNGQLVALTCSHMLLALTISSTSPPPPPLLPFLRACTGTGLSWRRLTGCWTRGPRKIGS